MIMKKAIEAVTAWLEAQYPSKEKCKDAVHDLLGPKLPFLFKTINREKKTCVCSLASLPV